MEGAKNYYFMKCEITVLVDVSALIKSVNIHTTTRHVHVNTHMYTSYNDTCICCSTES